MINEKIYDDIEQISSKEDLIFGSFLVGDLEIAINVDLVQEVVNFPDSFSRMPLPTSYLVGIFNLRGMIIPIINTKELISIGDGIVVGSEKIAIVDLDGAKVGLLFDRTSEIFRVNKEDISKTPDKHGQSTYMSSCIKIKEDSRILHVLNTVGLLNISNLSEILINQRISLSGLTHQKKQRNMKKSISFSVGPLDLCFGIDGIHEVIKVDELQSSHIQSELCLGRIDLRGLIIPVLNLDYFLEGTGYIHKNIIDQRIIILKDDSAAIALLVDNVDSIKSYEDSDLISIPVLRELNKEIFLGCISTEASKNCILLDHKVFLSNPDIIEISKGHDLIYNKDFKRDNLERKKVNNHSFISFQIDQRYGFEIKSIKEIVNFSEDIIPSPGSSSFIKGVLNLRGDSVTIVDTRDMYSMDKVTFDPAKAKILIFKAKSKFVGLIVDSLDSILTIDINTKIVLPNIVTRDIESRLGSDLKEVLVYNDGDEKDSVITILNIDSIAMRF